MLTLYTAVVFAGMGGEIYLLANDLEQSQSRVFKAAALILQASPLLRDSVDITSRKFASGDTGGGVLSTSSEGSG